MFYEGSESMSKIVVVDDEKEIADLIALYLSNIGFEVEVFYDSLLALDYLENNVPRLLILDIMMPQVDGLAIMKQIREKHYYPIILVTAKNEELDVIKGLMLGSDDYITKPFNPLEIVARVQVLLRRLDLYDKRICSNKDNKIIYKNLIVDFDKRECYLEGEKIHLTVTEFKIIEILIKNCGKKYSSEELFYKVTGDKYYEEACNSVATHVRNIRIKINDSFDNPKYIKTIWGEGYTIEKEC